MSQFGMARPLEITVQPYKPTHSNPQRRTFWMWAGEAAKQAPPGADQAAVGSSSDRILECFGERLASWEG